MLNFQLLLKSLDLSNQACPNVYYFSVRISFVKHDQKHQQASKQASSNCWSFKIIQTKTFLTQIVIK